MSFQIHDLKGRAIPIIELEREVCEFWNVKEDARYYAHPDMLSHYTNSWFDTIGWAIRYPENYIKGWNDVRCTLWTIQAKSLYEHLYDNENMQTHIERIQVFLKPYYDLIDHWESKGYIPVKIDDKTT